MTLQFYIQNDEGIWRGRYTPSTSYTVKWEHADGSVSRSQ
jgi:hypothetical protein